MSNNKEVHINLLIADVICIITSTICLAKFESKYWLVKGAAVNKSAGFGDIFHDWTMILFIAIPLITISQIALTILLKKYDLKKVIYGKVLAFLLCLLFLNKHKIEAEISQHCNWSALLFAVFGTLIFFGYFIGIWYRFNTEKGINSPKAFTIALGLIISLIATHLV